ncbi:hypothetical protein QJS10_CPB12g01019 [Acorus calamus]|uniref:Uncharacterized protein n=1 Tax=Acorus calamus TaxID=4465 RepID=A0AAV9DMJ0_ACOCL|nr:hypothetical protein QJS10_CPB12g01019 [Acorus calamus]
MKDVAALPFNPTDVIASGATAPQTKEVENLKVPLVKRCHTKEPQNNDAIGAASKNEDSLGETKVVVVDPFLPSTEAVVVHLHEECCPKSRSITAKSVEEFFPPQFMFDTPLEHSKGEPIRLQVVLHPQKISTTSETIGLRQQFKRNKKASQHTSNSLLDSSGQSGDPKHNK